MQNSKTYFLIFFLATSALAVESWPVWHMPHGASRGVERGYSVFVGQLPRGRRESVLQQLHSILHTLGFSPWYVHAGRSNTAFVGFATAEEADALISYHKKIFWNFHDEIFLFQSDRGSLVFERPHSARWSPPSYQSQFESSDFYSGFHDSFPAPAGEPMGFRLRLVTQQSIDLASRWGILMGNHTHGYWADFDDASYGQFLQELHQHDGDCAATA
ncbi:MAG: hypothetical protein V4534_06250 [Myxococcota bacterium]